MIETFPTKGRIKEISENLEGAFSVVYIFTSMSVTKMSTLSSNALVNIIFICCLCSTEPLSAVWLYTCSSESTSSGTSWTFCPWSHRLLGSGSVAGCKQSDSLQIWFLGFGRGRLDGGWPPRWGRCKRACTWLAALHGAGWYSWLFGQTCFLWRGPWLQRESSSRWRPESERRKRSR